MTATAIRLDITPAEYLADPAPLPSLSASLAKVLLDRSPLHAWARHPRLGGHGAAPTASMDRGTLIHALLLGKGVRFSPVDAADWRTKQAREKRDEARAAGHLPVLAADLAAAEAAAAKLRERLPPLLGDSEVPILWAEETADGPIWCRAMLDHLAEGGMLTIHDLKSTRTAHPDHCTRAAIRYGYDLQAAAYTKAVERLHPEYSGRIEFVLLFCELEPPYAVLPAVLDGLMRERGARRWAEAVATWGRCMASSSWPGYSTEPVTLWSPDWLLRKEAEAAAMRGEEFVYER